MLRRSTRKEEIIEHVSERQKAGDARHNVTVATAILDPLSQGQLPPDFRVQAVRAEGTGGIRSWRILGRRQNQVIATVINDLPAEDPGTVFQDGPSALEARNLRGVNVPQEQRAKLTTYLSTILNTETSQRR